jgi:hypothetical protein
MRRILVVLSLMLAAVVAIAWHRIYGTTTAWATPVTVTISALLAAGALGTIVATWRQSAKLHMVLGIGLLSAQLVIIVTRLAGMRLIAYDLFPDKKLAVVVAGCIALSIYGLIRHRVWGRWLAIALGATGAVSGGINTLHFWSVTAGPNPEFYDWSMQMHLAAWVLWVGTIGGLTVVLNLASPAVGAAIAARTQDSTWTAPTREARWVRATIITSLAAVPMLLVYAWLQPIVPSTQTSAIVLAAALAVGATAAIRGKLAGALILVLAGAGLVAQTAFTAIGAPPDMDRVTLYYAIFWLPAAVTAIGAGLALAKPVWRLLTQRA